VTVQEIQEKLKMKRYRVVLILTKDLNMMTAHAKIVLKSTSESKSEDKNNF